MDNLVAEGGQEAALPAELSDESFAREFGEDLEQVLDLHTWQRGTGLEQLYERLEAEVADAIAQEDRVRHAIRSVIFPRIADRSRPSAPRYAGVYSIDVEAVEKIHRGVLFSGDVEACDGIMQLHDSLAVTVIQIGICLVSYKGDEGTWAHRLYSRDLRGASDDPAEEALQLVEARHSRAATGAEDHRDRLTELGSRGVMTYAERAVLTDLSEAPWRMGHGNPAPYEILTGAGAMQLVSVGLDVLRRLLLDHRQFVFVPSSPRNRALLTIGQGLRPLEFAVVQTLRSQIEDIVERGNLRGENRENALDFLNTVGNEVCIGAFRVSTAAPPYIFYAPADPELCAQAAAIAMADAVLQDHRGFPLLIDMADQFCRASFGRDVFLGTLQSAYAAHGRPLAYLSEREPRR